MKNKILGLLVLFSFVGVSFAQISLNPVYSSDRFQPSDMFHAGCENEIDVVFDLDDSPIDGINAVLKYDSVDIKILKILVQGSGDDKLNYTVSDDTIIFTKLKSDNGGVDRAIFQVFFEGDDNLKTTNLSFEKGSYVIDDNGTMLDIDKSYTFNFATVPECEPDIVAPSVDMIFPNLDKDRYVALDSYFQFKIVDDGKGINKDDINISIDDIDYDLSNIEYDWDDDILTIYPDRWLNIGSEFSLIIEVPDKQVYGKANITIKKYELETSTGLYLLNEIDPVQFRKLVNKEKYYQGSIGECALLNKAYKDGNDGDKKLILSINKRLSCGEISLLFDEDNSGLINKDMMSEHNNGFSVFAILGWILFGLMLLLSIYGYIVKPFKK